MNIQQPTGGLAIPFKKRKAVDDDHGPRKKLPGFGWVPNSVRNHFIAMLGEFVGTFMFLFFAFSATQVANTGPGGGASPTQPNTSALLYISLAFGFSLAVNAWTFFRISGGLFNPAVTLGMCLIGAVPWIRGFLIIFTQMAGAIAAAAVVMGLFPGELKVRTTLSSGTSIQQGIFIEMFLTAQLVFTIFMLAAEKHKGTYLAPVGIGLSLFIAELSGVYYTGGSLNPARSFGPDAALGTFDSFHYIYWIGPFLGSLIAVIFYKIIKVLEYETANPGQDLDKREMRKQKPSDKPDPNSPDPPGVETSRGTHNQQDRHTRDDVRAHGRNRSGSRANAAASQRRYDNASQIERGEVY